MTWKDILKSPGIAWTVAFCCLFGGIYVAFKGINLPNPTPPLPPPGTPFLVGIPQDGFPLGALAKIKVALPEVLPTNFKSATITWKLLEVKNDNGILRLIEKVDVDVLGDSTLYFGTGIQNKELVCQALVTFLFVDEAKIATVKNFFLFQRVKIGNSPNPPPEPDPVNPIDPTFEEGRFGLAKFSYEAVKSTVKDKKKEGAKAIADSMQSMVAAVAAGTIKSPENLLTKTYENNNSALTATGINPLVWDEFFTKIQDRLFQLYQDKKLNVLDDYRVAFLEIVVGLSAVK